MRGLRIGRRRTNSFRFRYGRSLRSIAYSTLTKRANEQDGTPRTPEETLEFYGKIFKSLDINFPRLETLGSYRIPKDEGRRKTSGRHEMKSILHAECPEPPMKFETHREFPRRRIVGTPDGSWIGFRPERLPPPLPEGSVEFSEDNWDGCWEISRNPVKGTTQTSQSRPGVKVESRRYKFHSDKNHELSEDEDEEDAWSVWSLTTASVWSLASSSGKSTLSEDSEHWENRLGGIKEVIPSLAPSMDGNCEPELGAPDSTHHDQNRNSAFRTSSASASDWKQAPRPDPDMTSQLDLSPFSEEEKSVREPSVAGSSSFPSLIGKFGMVAVTPGTELPPIPWKLSEAEDRSDDDDDDDQDILIIGLTQEEMDEFK